MRNTRFSQTETIYAVKQVEIGISCSYQRAVQPKRISAVGSPKSPDRNVVSIEAAK